MAIPGIRGNCYAGCYSVPLPVADDARWSAADGTLPPGRCQARGCVLLPGATGLCPDHQRERAAADAVRPYRWNGDPRLAARDLRPPSPLTETQLADSWAAIFCQFRDEYPACRRKIFLDAYRRFAAERIDVSPTSARVLYRVLTDRGATLVRRGGTHHLSGVRLIGRDAAA